MASQLERDVPLRERRSNISQILRDVEAGQRVHVTVRGRHVADLVPPDKRRVFVPRDVIERIIREHPLDKDFERDIKRAVDNEID